MATTRMVGRVSVRVMPDSRRFRPDLLKDLQALEKSLSVSIPTRLDTTKVAADAARVKADVEKRLGHASMDVDVDSGAASAELALLARDRTSTVKVDVDRAGLSRVRALLGGLTSGLGRITGGAAGVGAIAGAFSTLAAGAAAAVVPVLQLGTALAPAVGILATLPAAAAMTVTALAPLVIAFQGMGDALGAALSGDADALAESLEDLTPAARGVVLAVRDMAPALGDIRDVVQDNFFAPLVGPVAQLGDRLLPVLNDGLGGVAVALGYSTARLVAFVGEAENLNGLRLLFESTGRSVATMSDFFPGLLTGVRELGVVGLPFMERFSEVLNEGAIRFGEWATAAAESGQATRWIKEAIEVFQELGAIASNVGGILGSIFTAAGDGGILGTIEQLTGRLDDFFKSAEGGKALQGVFEGLAEVGNALSPVLSTIASSLGQLSPMIGRLATGFGPVLTRAIEGLTPALLRLEPGLMAIIDGLGRGVDALVSSGALESMGAALSEIMVALSPLLPVLGELAATLGLALADALIVLAPGLETLATHLADTIGPMLPELSASFSDLVEAIGPLIPPLVEALLPALDLLPPLLELLVENFDTWAATIVDLTPEIILIIGWLGTLGAWIVRLIGWVLELLAGWLRWAGETSQKLRDALRTMLDRVREFVDNARTRFEGFLTAARLIWAAIRSVITTAATNVRDAVVGAFQRLVSGARERISTFLEVVRRIRTAIVTAVSGFGTLLRTAGRNVIQGLINGITSKLSDLRSKMQQVASDVRGALPFSPAKYGPLRTHPPDVAGETITRMIADGLERGRRIVAAAAGDVAGAAVLEINAHPLSPVADRAPDPEAPRQSALLEQLLQAVLAADRDVVLRVDSKEVARATRQGERQLSRR